MLLPIDTGQCLEMPYKYDQNKNKTQEGICNSTPALDSFVYIKLCTVGTRARGGQGMGTSQVGVCGGGGKEEGRGGGQMQQSPVQAWVTFSGGQQVRPRVLELHQLHEEVRLR